MKERTYADSEYDPEENTQKALPQPKKPTMVKHYLFGALLIVVAIGVFSMALHSGDVVSTVKTPHVVHVDVNNSTAFNTDLSPVNGSPKPNADSYTVYRPIRSHKTHVIKKG